MAGRKRATKRIPANGNASADLTTPKVPRAPFSEERRAELDSGELPDYDAMTDDELKALVLQKNIGLRGRHKRAHKVNALRKSDAKDVAKYQAWKYKTREDRADVQPKKENGHDIAHEPEEHLHSLSEKEKDEYRKKVELNKQLGQRQGLMFASKYQTDPTRKSFLDLPANIRYMIYAMALFGTEDHVEVMKISYVETKDQYLPFFRQYLGRPYGSEIMISVLDMMGAMNQQIRSEIRTFFYAKMPLTLQGCIPEETDAHGLVQRLIMKIGVEGRASLPSLRISLGGSDGMDYKQPGYDSFHSLLETMTLCQNLEWFDFQLAVSHFFHTDVEPLKAYFCHEAALESLGLERFATFLASMPNLRSIHLIMKSYPRYNGSLEGLSGDDLFRHFAFTGMREVMLWVELENRLQANNVYKQDDSETRKVNGRTFLWIRYPIITSSREGDEIMDFSTWVAWHNKAFPKAVQGDDARVELVDDE
ncbi:uncharacterized protein K460DRAFT_408783 [Cucurbitaria berberidis CBS 394.84]|uniref:Uncharacterized protein n=1 Tax=Cucurbitaria berberidis CBS 394.84 TaxID=1168544 RepID=A0A9P4G8Y1_9PLEO|nr:uncharacterized protein K460DRAFT_408783 [Cucurbitaria berberidis CBS 394.84]KAF1841308.1 hypothetical protein K460DRAFT_408783 [Cucurbitaria berberidis CBS 394.84]